MALYFEELQTLTVEDSLLSSLVKIRPFFRLFPKITTGGERLEVKMQIRDQLVTSLSAFPPPTLACANYPRTAASRVYLPLGRG